MTELEDETEEEARERQRRLRRDISGEYDNVLRLEPDKSYILQLTDTPEPSWSDVHLKKKEPYRRVTSYIFFVMYEGKKYITMPGADFTEQMIALTKRRGSLVGAVIQVVRRLLIGQRQKWRCEITELKDVERAMIADATEEKPCS